MVHKDCRGAIWGATALGCNQISRYHKPVRSLKAVHYGERERMTSTATILYMD